MEINSNMHIKSEKEYTIKLQASLFIILTCLLLVVFYLYISHDAVSFSFFPDEFGYWAVAAHFIGYDWSSLASLGSYYSFGYSLLLAPILFFAGSSVTAYQLSIFLNCIFQIAGFLLVLRLSGSLYPNVDIRKKIFISAIGTFYPAWLFYSQMSMTESLLTFLFILICNLIWDVLKNPNTGKIVLLVVVNAYAYTVHMRFIGVWLSVIILLTYYLFFVYRKKPISSIFIVFILSLFLFFISYFVKKHMLTTVFTNMWAKSPAPNTYSGQWSKLAALFTVDGFISILAGFCGKLGYIWAASLGMIIFFLRKCFFEIKNYKTTNNSISVSASSFFYPWLLISFFSELLISTIFFIGTQRADGIFYGRYTDPVIPIILVLSILSINDSRSNYLRLFISNVAFSLCIVLGALIVSSGNYTPFRGYMAIIFSPYIYEPSAQTPLPMQHFEDFISLMSSNIGTIYTICICSIITSWIISYIVLILTQIKNADFSFVLITIVILELCTAIYSSHEYTIPFNSAHRSNQKIYTEKYFNESETEDPTIVYFLKEDSKLYISAMQMMNENTDIVLINPKYIKDNYRQYDNILAYRWSDYASLLDTLYENKLITSTYYWYYH